MVSFQTTGGSRVAWTLRQDFLDAPPLSFLLEVGSSNNPDADDWEAVGAPVVDVFSAVDGQQRSWSKGRHQFYRVKLETSKGTYYSDPTSTAGTLGSWDWRIAREIIRVEMLRMRMNGNGQIGYLLKRRITGVPCPHCLDYLTNEVRQPTTCRFCWGTSFLCGYYYPIDCVWADLGMEYRRARIDPTLGTIAPVVITARMINTWMVETGDVWVNKATDDRYYIHGVKSLKTRRGVSLVAEVEMKLAPSTDIIYSIPIPDQVMSEELLLSPRI